jgi:hypothetical protein
MNNYNFLIYKVIEELNSNLYHTLKIKVSIVEGKFLQRAIPPYLKVISGQEELFPFKIRISPNLKELVATFTSDAFDSISGVSSISFGYVGEQIGLFENVIISEVLVPMPVQLDDPAIPNADNNWLSIL